MVILQRGNETPFMQGKTSLDDNKTILYNDEKSLTSFCKCGKPFAESLMEIGIIFDAVICSNCNREMAFIVEK